MPFWSKIAAGVALAAAIAVAGIAANLYLLGVGGADADPVGRLTPRSELPSLPVATTQGTGATTTDDRDGGHDGDGDDD